MGDVVRRTAALRELEARFPKLRPRIDLERDQSGRAVDWQVPGRHGYAYAHDGDHMAVVVEARTVAGALRRSDRWPVLQDGDFETTFLVADADFLEVARRVRLKQHRRATPAQLAHLRDLHERRRNQSAEAHSGVRNATKWAGTMEVPAGTG